MTITANHLYRLAGADWDLAFTESATAVLSRHAQRRWYQRESVGQLFSSDLTRQSVLVEAATELRPRGTSWASVTFDFEEAREQREELYRKGMYCVGLWHTHPESCPVPSGADARLAADHAQAARPVLNGLVFVIVGNKPFPSGWYVGVHDGQQFHVAKRSASLK